MVYDMNLNKFPVEEKNFSAEKSAHSISLKDVKLYLELQHVGFEGELKEYFAHFDGNVYSKFKTEVCRREYDL